MATRSAARRISTPRGYHTSAPLAPIRRVYLEGDAVPCEQAIRAIERADVIVIGPGDLYTSILPNLLVEGVSEAIRASEAEKIYVCNLMTKHGETDGYKASDFVREIHRYLGGPVDRVILHDGSFPPHLVDAYAAQEQFPVQPDEQDRPRDGPGSGRRETHAGPSRFAHPPRPVALDGRDLRPTCACLVILC